MHKLPIGIQDFPKIRENDFHYVDKTAVIHRLLNVGSTFFLARPRRFGKSLLCSTLGAIFNARRELFAGLALDTLDWAWRKHPVIRLDLNVDVVSSGAALGDTLSFLLERNARENEVVLSGSTPAQQLLSLIDALVQKNGERAVIIIDEYDKPLLSTIDTPALHDEIRTVLKGFYGVLKQSDADLAFIFLTGVTKFSQVSVFSDLNQLQDISMDARFCDICGIRQDELERDFAAEISHYAREQKTTEQEYLGKLRKWYNGYRFSESSTAVYNPFGLFNHFATGKMEPYWFSTGTPTFLLKLIENQKIDIRNLENLELKADDFGDYRKDTMEAIPVLYQAGYLTITDYDPRRNMYTLDYPNDEVRVSFAKALADRYAYA